ncbi:DNA gyrase subunit A [Geobacter sulfurreducens]|jgi:DNA gyrase subunit A|uniref:DNA gyrase subunit A n=1 Tax=Geobacter sulfurreducens (strain ATCC 51573 / DSM 12127 / PCA) TaxID=243231 RepID=Q74H88_GEOSL|nr:DNA gyrase subunit A [Geobacter sulfurreducens]AAR33339.1 DNA gyrase, A subunit [Geobacter sulfurreducens PCA]ADI82868.1 DNA gyrase, A subunit [Geobacter sulfurreducens KN400]AJY69720.1 DNA gyrase subunit A [Geobacter sulfurreducens]QVW35279.1 DNA gyrase subunit A [Geobacter sulfurreducens]UAC04117.1 DNA gyrase subunit A [Geobacter sulfurreducens]
MLEQSLNKTAVNIEDEMKRSYMDYAMSVIIGRALPDVRDGLKPVHRRCLYAMYDMGNDYNKPYKKSARVVGDVIGKYHPHGDAAAYDTIVRMAQDFSLRYPLVDGQGNFGSVDGDSPAAMRYTEIRMEQLAHELLNDLEKETVDLGPNYDGSLTEPLVLPSKFPNLLVNGSSGIAVGMATNIPPHNLTEVINGIIATIENPNISFEELLALIPGPDFPTGGFIYGREGILQGYRTGRGIVQMRARASIETHKKTERQSIIVTEIPYQVNKANLITKIAELVREKKLEGISDIRDESDRDGMRIVIDLKRDENPQVILNHLYKQTQMQTSFGINMLAIVAGRPRVLTLRDAIGHFIDHRREIVTRRTIFDLKKAEARAHILEGYKIALDWLDAVIELIRGSKTPAEAKEGLMSGLFSDEEWLRKMGLPLPAIHSQYQKPVRLTEVQAQEILNLRLHRLTGLERDKILQEYDDILKYIARLKEILASEAEILKIIVGELRELKEKFGDERRTEIVDRSAEISLEDTIVEEDVVVTVSHTGYIKRTAVSQYRSQRRGGKGKTGMKTKEEDFVEHLFVASSKDFMLFFTDAGKVYQIKVYEIPEGGRATRGKAIVNLLNLQENEQITAILSVKGFDDDRNIIMATRLGVVKKSPLREYANIRSGGIIAVNLDDGDKLIAVALTDGRQDVLLASKNGKSIRFHEDDARPMGRVSRGVRGMSLEDDDVVIGMEIINPNATGSTIFTVTENGFGKRTELDEYRVQSRGGKGIITIKTTERNGCVVDIMQVTDENDLMLITDQGKILRIPVAQFSVIGRNTQGVRLMTAEQNERIVAVAKLAEKDEGDDGADGGDDLPDAEVVEE